MQLSNLVGQNQKYREFFLPRQRCTIIKRSFKSIELNPKSHTNEKENRHRIVRRRHQRNGSSWTVTGIERKQY